MLIKLHHTTQTGTEHVLLFSTQKKWFTRNNIRNVQTDLKIEMKSTTEIGRVAVRLAEKGFREI